MASWSHGRSTKGGEKSKRLGFFFIGGDLFMENFKLYNGDCLEIMDSLISKGIKVDAIITDPPYG